MAMLQPEQINIKTADVPDPYVALQVWTAAADPGVSDDLDGGWAAGSLWYNSTAGRLWVCTDNTNGAAVWNRIALGDLTFLGLGDTPNSYSGQALKVLRVNAGATAIEFVTLAGGGDMLAANNLGDLADAPTARSNLGLGSMATQAASSVAITGGTVTANFRGLATKDSGGDHSLIIASAEDLSANRRLDIAVNDAGRQLTIAGDATISGTNTGDETGSTANIAFTDGDTSRRTTISNAAVTASSVIVGAIRRPNVAEDSDKGYFYSFNIVSIGTGTFDVITQVTDADGLPVVDDPPNETIVFHYLVL